MLRISHQLSRYLIESYELGVYRRCELISAPLGMSAIGRQRDSSGKVRACAWHEREYNEFGERERESSSLWPINTHYMSKAHSGPSHYRERERESQRCIRQLNKIHLMYIVLHLQKSISESKRSSMTL